jgi:hypothetical protein
MFFHLPTEPIEPTARPFDQPSLIKITQHFAGNSHFGKISGAHTSTALEKTEGLLRDLAREAVFANI